MFLRLDCQNLMELLSLPLVKTLFVTFFCRGGDSRRDADYREVSTILLERDVPYDFATAGCPWGYGHRLILILILARNRLVSNKSA